MKKLFTQRLKVVSISCALVFGAWSGNARSETMAMEQGYLTDSSGTVVRNNYGDCWRSGSNPSQASVDQCGSHIVSTPASVPIVKTDEPTPQTEVMAPEVVAVPEAVKRQVTLDADALFDFDRATLRPEGRKVLDDFVEKMNNINPEMITAVGHTDRIGKKAYNQRLSEHRAEAVKSYLVSKGIDANRVHVEGRGATEPVTKTGECDGVKSAKVIACLQPDRRVDVEVTGKENVK
jgi:OOP family OmpA-OmpF porin